MELDDFDDDPVRDFCCLYISFVGIVVFVDSAIEFVFFLYWLRLPVPVISVGNLTWGGNGKTPMVEFLARSFADDGISPLILTRVYCIEFLHNLVTS